MGKMESQDYEVNQDLQALSDHGEFQDSKENLVMWASLEQRVKLAQ